MSGKLPPPTNPVYNPWANLPPPVNYTPAVANSIPVGTGHVGGRSRKSEKSNKKSNKKSRKSRRYREN